MIIKIERYDKSSKYWLIDNIKKVNVSINLITRIEHKKNIDDISILDCWNNTTNEVCSCEDENEACSNCTTSIRLICRSNDGNEFSILFDTIAYILNDNGKTIEKVVANYDG